MSTRAVVEFRQMKEQVVEGGKVVLKPVENEGREIWSLYCHGDGYPSFLGAAIEEAITRACQIDPNFPNEQFKIDSIPEEERKKGEKKGYYMHFCLPNAACEASKLAVYLVCFLWEKGYGGCYLTTRDPAKEIEEDWTDIEYLYRVSTYSRAKVPTMECLVPNKSKFKKLSKKKYEEEKKR